MPEGSELEVNPVLTNVSLSYRPVGLIGRELLPDMPVAKKEGTIKKYKKDERFTIPDTTVGPKSEPNEVEWNVTEDTYASAVTRNAALNITLAQTLL